MLKLKLCNIEQELTLNKSHHILFSSVLKLRTFGNIRFFSYTEVTLITEPMFQLNLYQQEL